MAGHSKWANIKHRKGAQDAKRSKEFQKVSKEIMVAMKEGGNDPDTNARLRLAIDKAKSVNMPNDNIKRLLEKNNKDTSSFTEITYEGYGAGGVAVIVECLTDNINRTAPQIKSTFSKNGGNLGTSGSVNYMFDTKGQIVLDKEIYNIDEIMMIAMELDVIDVKEEDDFVIIETTPSSFMNIKEKLIENKIDNFITSGVQKVANTIVEGDDELATKIERLVDALEDLDDVQNVYTNFE